ncbi:MAG: hypothetical protein SCH70_14200 [Candidatus Methanoperedens sp.]|nr:hypothetical protein [Candidatus Methanoperedens sp.]
MLVLEKDSVDCDGSEENKPQISADARGFVASNPVHLIGSWDLAFFLFLSFSYVYASGTIRRVAEYGFGIIIFQVLQDLTQT